MITEPREGDGEQGLRARRVARAALLSVGDELLQGRVTDTNAPYLATRLAEAGVPTVEVRVLGDAERPLAQALTELNAVGTIDMRTVESLHCLAWAVGRQLQQCGTAHHRH